MMKVIIWALFDSGNGCYTQVAKNYDEIEIYPIGIDIENKNDNFINLNLADYSRLFNNDKLFVELDKLPKPDIILASPPCESWSVASTMKDGNACWKQETFEDSLFLPQRELSKFTIRPKKDYENVQFIFEKSIIKRINGELCTINTIEIIKRYKPKVYVIENPFSSKIWGYIDEILGFQIPYENKATYISYNYPITKPTKFKSNIKLPLKYELKKGIGFKHFSRRYNERSNIPLELIKVILNASLEYVKSFELQEKASRQNYINEELK